MNINSPFEILELNKKELLKRIRQSNYQYKYSRDKINFASFIGEFSLLIDIEIYFVFNKVSSISYSYHFNDFSTDEQIFKVINDIKKIYKDIFDLDSYFDNEDAKSFWYSFSKDKYNIYMFGTGKYHEDEDRYICINHHKKQHHKTVVKDKTKSKKLIIKEKEINKLSRDLSLSENVWYGKTHILMNTKPRKYACSIEVYNEKIIINELVNTKIKKSEILFDSITYYNFHEDFISMFYSKKHILITILKNDVNKLDSIIRDKIGYNSKKYIDLNEIIKKAFYEYNPFDETVDKEKRYNYLVKNLTKRLYREKSITIDVIYGNLCGIDFDMYFYIEWKNFANYLYNELKDNNYM